MEGVFFLIHMHMQCINVNQESRDVKRCKDSKMEDQIPSQETYTLLFFLLALLLAGMIPRDSRRNGRGRRASALGFDPQGF